jgi:hypothetical protein
MSLGPGPVRPVATLARMTRGACLAALAAVALAAAGCGGGGDDKSGPDHDFIVKADRLCVDALRVGASPKNDAQAVELAAREARERRALQAKLEGIQAPGGLRDDYRDYIARSRALIVQLERMTATARSGRTADYSLAAMEFERIARAREAVADRIGFRRCGQPFTSEVREALEP